MKHGWLIEPDDVRKVQALVARHEDNPFVKKRVRRNLSADKPRVGKEAFWQQMVCCLLTTQQRSDPNTPVGRFIGAEPFGLGYAVCVGQKDLRGYAKKLLTDFQGICRTTVIPDHLAENLELLEQGFWKQTLNSLENLRLHQDQATERKTADFMAKHFAGFGPKQSRNLLQCLGLTRYEIPIDSRVIDWLTEFGFPVHLSANVLGDRHYYCFVLDGVQELCKASGVMPCVLDAAIFVDRNPTAWTEENVERIF
jgi:hypothetical protein